MLEPIIGHGKRFCNEIVAFVCEMWNYSTGLGVSCVFNLIQRRD